MDIRQRLLATFQIDHREHVERIRALLGTVGSSAGGLPDGAEMDPRKESKPALSKDEIWWEEQGRDLSIPIINPATDAWNFAHKNRIFLSGFGSQSGIGHLTRYGNAFLGQELANAICRMLRH